MKVYFVNIPDRYHRRINETAKLFLGKFPINQRSSLNIEFVSRKKIQALNKKYRQIDQPTDVLSFPLWSSIKEIPKEGEVSLGDIVICPEETALDENLAKLVEHSLNHLIGIHH